MISTKLYLPMTTRPAGYCVTQSEQSDLARKFGLTVATVRERIQDLATRIEPQKTANRTKLLIEAELKTVM
jgi:hypothetical protein